MKTAVNSKRVSLVLAAIVIGLIGVSTPALAQGSVSMVSGLGVVLPYPGAYVVDPRVQISRDGGLTWQDAAASDQDWGPGPEVAGSYLVGPYPMSYGNPESYRFRTTFSLPKGFTSPSLVGRVLSDDQTGGVIVNGETILSNPTGWDTWPTGSGFFDYSTSDSNLFHCGVNTLEFDVTNLGGVGGVWFAATASYQGGEGPSCAGTATEQVADLMPIVQAIGGGSFSSQLTNVEQALSQGRKTAARGSLNSFANHVKAQAGKKKITDAEAQQILDALAQISASIGQ